MKLFKRFTVQGGEYQIVNEEIRLDIDRPGLAIIQVVADEPLSGRVRFSLGWHFDPHLTLFFTGEIARCTQVDGKQYRLLCPELSARLDNTEPVALRHPTMQDVIARYAELTGLSFIVPAKPYAETRVPAFYGLGSVFHAMKNLGQVFHVEDYVWLTQGDGRVFAGAWQDSRWKGREIAIPQAVFNNVSAGGERVMTALPALRPGCEVNGERVQSVWFSGHEMRVKCKII